MPRYSSKYRPKQDDDRMSEPRAFNLENEADVKRLFSELEGYMRVSLNDGTDAPGRAYAFAALRDLNTRNGLERLIGALNGMFAE